MRKVLTLAAVLVALLGLSGEAMATHGYQLIGIGQTQKGIGGAVTAAPTDAMTAISNPAGMARIGTRADFSMELFMPTRKVDFGALGGGSTEGGSELYGVPSIGWTAPAFGREDVFFGGGMYATSGLGVDYGEVVMAPGAAFGLSDDVTFDGYSAIQFFKMAPTVAWNVNDRLSLGFSVNLDYQSVAFRQRLRNVPMCDAPTCDTTFTPIEVNLDLGRPTAQLGFGATVGVIYDVNEWLTVGASYASEQFFGKGEYRVGTDDILNFNGATGMPGTYELDLNFPQQASIGIAVKPHQRVVVSADVKWINWSSTHDKVALSGPAGSFFAPANPTGSSTGTDLNFGWDDQWAFGVGVQFMPNERLMLHGGYSYSEAPIDEADVFNNLIFPAFVEHHLAGGFSYSLGGHWGIGGTVMHAFKETIVGSNDIPAGFQPPNFPFPASSGVKSSLQETSLGLHLNYKF